MRLTYFSVVLAASLACAFSAQPARADLYLWIDENNVTNITDKPPADQSLIVEVLSIAAQRPPEEPVPPAPPVAAQLAELRALTQRLERLERQLEEERRDFAAAQPTPLPQNTPAPTIANGNWSVPPFVAPPTVIVSVPFVHRFDHNNKSSHFNKFRQTQRFRHFGKFPRFNSFPHSRPGVIQPLPRVIQPLPPLIRPSTRTIQSRSNSVPRAGGFHNPRASFRMR